MAVIARDAVARDHLVYAWPLPIGPEGCEVSCGEDEQVVMCPAWMVGDRLGPGRHHWRTPDPTRPVSAFFVSTTAVAATFDMTTAFMIPNTRQPVRLRATGVLQVRCGDPGLLIAQFVGLPFDAVNEGILRSVSRSIERMLARLLTRRVVMAGTPAAVTDPAMLPNIVEELIAYNPTAGAVFGIELLGVGQIVIGADDGTTPFVMLPVPVDSGTWREPQDEPHVHAPTNGQPARASQPEIPLAETPPNKRNKSLTVPGPHASGEILSGEISAKSSATQRHASVPPVDATEPGPGVKRDSSSNAVLAGEIVARPTMPLPNPPTLPPHGSQPPIEMPRSADEITQPGVPTPVPGSLTLRGIASAEPPSDAKAAATPDPASASAPKARTSSPSIPPPIPTAALRHTPAPQLIAASPLSTLSGTGAAGAAGPSVRPTPPPVSQASNDESRGSIIGIGMSAIGSTGAVAGEIPTKVPPGSRVLVPGPNGLMQSATVRQLLQGYYELEVGSSGETIWVPINGVVPE